MATYQVEVKHDGLNKYRLVKGTDRYVVEQKARAQTLAWEEMWSRRVKIESERNARQQAAEEKESKKEVAAERTMEARNAICEIEEILRSATEINHVIDWEEILDKTPFPKLHPSEPVWIVFPREPLPSDSEFKPIKKWYYIFSNSFLNQSKQLAGQKFIKYHKKWKDDVIGADEANKRLENNYRENIENWEKEKNEYEAQIAEKNGILLLKKQRYLSGDPQEINEYCDMVLANSDYPDTFPKEWDLNYNEVTKTLVVEYFLPSPKELPTLKEVKYIASRDEFTETYLPENSFNKMYDNAIYQITLRTVYELFDSDSINSIEAVVFNGWVRAIDKATGKTTTACVVSLQVKKDEFMKLDLMEVDPKTCFKNLRGVGSSKLYGLTPIAPILSLNKNDKRFISSYSITGDIDETTNLASISWEDFEHLIREIFEKEFSQNGGEVKITQASRDGGVDAVAFDPDPIRGGKIVIQAKRYTNTVGLSAVRDLYGTVLNEGATKGILVTTADYGPDAYSFANSKPLTLLNGANLLHLLEKHGHKATIDLKAAKLAMSEKKGLDNG